MSSKKSRRSKKSPSLDEALGFDHNFGGRPSKYDPKFCHELIKFARSPEGSFNAFAAKLCVSRETIDEWASKHPEFSDAKKTAKRLNEKAMLDIGLKGMNGKLRVGAWQSAWIFAMKARHGWREEDDRDTDDSEMEFDTGGGE